MTEAFGFGSSGTVVDDTAIPDNPALDADEDFQFDESTGGGEFPPQLTPGPVTFRYECTEFKAAEGGRPNELTYTAHVQTAGLTPGRILRDRGLTEIPVRFNRSSDYKSDKMKEKKVPSDMERLYSGLGLVDEIGKPSSRAQMIEVLRGANGRTAQGSVAWGAAIKIKDGEYEVYSTSPNTKRGEKPWPRNPDGTLATSVKFSTGDTKMAREEIRNVRQAKARS